MRHLNEFELQLSLLVHRNLCARLSNLAHAQKISRSKEKIIKVHQILVFVISSDDEMKNLFCLQLEMLDELSKARWR